MRYSLGLQSAASDGAVGWGVLDRLLEDERIELDGVSGASSGAMNTLLLGYGLASGGRNEARAVLDRFWRLASERSGTLGADLPTADLIFGRGNLEHLPQFWASTAMVQTTSPYLWNPLNFNFIRQLLATVVDFKRLREACPVRLFISATDALKAKAHIFRNQEINLEAAAASACLPLYFQAVEIDGNFFWDGGLIGAPKLQPLVDECDAEDILVIRVSPIVRPTLPRHAFNIIERMIELTVAVGLDEELRRIELISELIEQRRLKPGDGVRRVRIHHIEGTEMTRKLAFSGKYNLDWKYLCDMRDFGRELAENWLAKAPHAVEAKADPKPHLKATSR